MGKINLLDKNVSELIAAGEVIERPASIVKELLENSIDAGATAITVEIRGGGIQYIRVTDNGSGISPEDVPTAFLRHATSKIHLSDDLNSIATLGFRGEALASIAAVTRLEIVTKLRENQFGVRSTLEGGEQCSLEETGCPDGTTIIARDLFYNVPARLKFLRRDISEAGAVGGILDKIALSHPEISIKFVSDRKVKLHTPGNGDLLSAIHAVFGSEFSSAMIPVDYGTGGISVSGYTSATQYSRQNRGMQHFFVNSRYVRSRTCMAALEEGYKNSIMVGKYPFCVINVTVPYNMVDVNVHPAKTEVRFVNDRPVFDAFYFAIKSALSKDDILKKAAQDMPKTQVENLLSTFHPEEAEQTNLPQKSAPNPVKGNGITDPPAPKSPILTVREPVAELRHEPPPPKPALDESFQYISADKLRIPEKPSAPEPVTFIRETEDTEPTETEPAAPALQVRVIGELFRTYVLFASEDTFFLLDKHAAHERILFEKLKRSVKTDARQVLLKPVVISVSGEEYQALAENTALLEQMGFAYEEFGSNSFLIREVPMVLSRYDITDIFLDIAGKLCENRRDVSSDIFEDLLHSMACRSAIKANDTNNMEELTELLRQVYANDEIRHCPHGRPVAIAMTKSEIERRFGRM